MMEAIPHSVLFFIKRVRSAIASGIRTKFVGDTKNVIHRSMVKLCKLDQKGEWNLSLTALILGIGALPYIQQSCNGFLRNVPIFAQFSQSHIMSLS